MRAFRLLLSCFLILFILPLASHAVWWRAQAGRKAGQRGLVIDRDAACRRLRS